MNCEGNRLSILLNDTQGLSSLVVYDAEADKFFSVPSSDCIIQHSWDMNEPKLFACEVLSKGGEELSNSHINCGDVQFLRSSFVACPPLFDLPGKPSSNVGLHGIAINGPCKVATFFATADRGVIPHDTVVIEKTGPGRFIGIDVPYYHFVQDSSSRSKSKKKGKASGSAECAVGRQLMQNFTGDEALNESMKSSLIAFSFNLAVGDMDKAYQEMRLIRDIRVG